MRKSFFISFLSLALLIGCTNASTPAENSSEGGQSEVPSQEPENSPTVDEEETEDPIENDTDDIEEDHADSIERYLPPEETVKSFKGEGNGFAEEKETVFQRQGNYLPTTVNNGGTIFLRIYEITDSGLYIVYEEPEFYNDEPPSLESLSAQFSRVELLTLPLEIGKMINGWVVTAVEERIALPIGEITGVIVLEKQEGSGSINRQYWAPNYGVVKKEFYFKDESGIEMIVTTELESIEYVTK